MSEPGAFPAAQTGGSKEGRTVKHEMELAPFPVGPLAARKGALETRDTGSPSWPGAMPVPQARPQPQGREPKPRTGQSAAENRDPLLTVEEFADELRVTRACVRKWILTRKVGVVKVGRLVRLRSSELRRIVDEGSRPRAESR
jgi:excisionase family DNA binding protein